MPSLNVARLEDIPWREVKPQRHGDRRVAVHNRLLFNVPGRRVLYTRYDPGLVIERHTHAGDEVIFILEGEAQFGDRHCRPGDCLFLEKGATIGPTIAGDQGTVLFEVFIDGYAATPVDDAEFQRLLAARGTMPLS